MKDVHIMKSIHPFRLQSKIPNSKSCIAPFRVTFPQQNTSTLTLPHSTRRKRPHNSSNLVSNCWQCDQQLTNQQHRSRHRHLLHPITALPNQPDNNSRQDNTTSDTKTLKDTNVGVKIALGMLHFYKTAISPLLPPACRFLPTCSSYAVDAYSEYGVCKGTILTAWRLMRCSPFGNSGYDPVQWPPPGLEWMFRS